MKLADRVRRALGSDAGPVRANGAEGSARVAETEGRPDHRIYELRRAIGRIESRWAGEVSAAVTRPVLRARAAGPAWVRTSAVPMLHERGCAREERFGDTRLEPPGSEALAELLRVAV